MHDPLRPKLSDRYREVVDLWSWWVREDLLYIVKMFALYDVTFSQAHCTHGVVFVMPQHQCWVRNGRTRPQCEASQRQLQVHLTGTYHKQIYTIDGLCLHPKITPLVSTQPR